MVLKILIVVLLIMGICGCVTSATPCVKEMIACTKQMINDMAAAANKTLMCGIVEKFVNCVEYSCSGSLSQCDLNKARSLFVDLLTDYSFRCATYMPRYGDDCNLPGPASSSACSLLPALSFLYASYILNYIL